MLRSVAGGNRPEGCGADVSARRTGAPQQRLPSVPWAKKMPRRRYLLASGSPSYNDTECMLGVGSG
jgi:hypothetical protein